MASTKSTPGSVHVLDTHNEYKEFILEAKGIAVLDAFAEWCGPCKVIAPHVEKMAGKYEHARFYKFDVDKVPDLAQELAIQAMPTFLVFKDGSLEKTIVGANPKKLEEAVTSLKPADGESA